MTADRIPATVRAQWRVLDDAVCTRITTGLINKTYLATRPDGERAVLQRLHPVFDPAVNTNIEVVTTHLAEQGLCTPRLVPCNNDAPFFIDNDHCWRVLTFIDGRSFDAITDPQMAWQAGQLVARFHGAMGDFEYDYAAERSSVHDTRAHLAHLRSTLGTYTDHRLFDPVRKLSRRVLSAVSTYRSIDDLPPRHAHGDLKISNILYNDAGKALCLIDLDTVAYMPWPLEMGDALRSWCNPRTEDALRADLDLDVLEAAIAGYAEVRPAWLTHEETSVLINGLERICLELSARFLADALTESYFSWDSANYENAGDHNLARGRATARLYVDVCHKHKAAQDIVDRYFDQPRPAA